MTPASASAVGRMILAATALTASLVAAPATASAQEFLLAYAVPDDPEVRYRVESSISQEMTSPVGTVGYSFATDIVLAAAFAEESDGVRVTAAVASVTATVATPGQTRELEPEVRGAYTFLLSPRGEVRLLALPELPGIAASATPISAVAYELFPRLPGTEVADGHRWEDTVGWSADSPQGLTTSATTFRYRLNGDTLVAGRAMLKIVLAGEGEWEAKTTMGGVSVTLTASGPVAGTALWDREAGILHSMDTSYEFEGTAATALGKLPITVRGSVQRERIQ